MDLGVSHVHCKQDKFPTYIANKTKHNVFSRCRSCGKPSTNIAPDETSRGTYLEKNCPSSNSICLFFLFFFLGGGGLNPRQDGMGHLCSEN